MDYKEENYLSILEDEKDEETNSFCCNSDEESDIDIDRDLDREFDLKETSSKPPANSPFFPPPPSAPTTTRSPSDLLPTPSPFFPPSPPAPTTTSTSPPPPPSFSSSSYFPTPSELYHPLLNSLYDIDHSSTHSNLPPDETTFYDSFTQQPEESPKDKGPSQEQQLNYLNHNSILKYRKILFFEVLVNPRSLLFIHLIQPLNPKSQSILIQRK